MNGPIQLRITHSQLQKIKRGQCIQIPNAHICNAQGHKFANLHPETQKKLLKAHRAKKGARVHITPAELEGTGLMDVIKKVGSFVQKHGNVLKPLATAGLDTLSHFVPATTPYREGFRDLTGVGVKPRKAPAKKRKAPTRRRISNKMTGSGLIPAGYGGF